MPVGRPLRTLAAGLLLAVAVWVAAQVLLALALLVGALVAALLLTALLAPLAARLRTAGAPPGLAAGTATLALLGGLSAGGVLLYSRASARVRELPPVIVAALDTAREWLVEGPLQLDPEQVRRLRDAAVGLVLDAVPAPLAGAMTALRVMSAAAIAVFAVFFLLQDGPGMWRWLLGWLPPASRRRTDLAGRAAWQALSGYVRGILLVAAVDAVAIGGVLLVVGVPLWLSLTVLTFLGAFVPIVGATVTGAVAVLVTLATEGGTDAVVVLVAVIAVQQLEGNLLHPLIVGRAVHLHPLAVLCSVTAGVLLLGVAGALVAVPLTAVLYRAAAALRDDVRLAEVTGDGLPGPGGAGRGTEEQEPPAGGLPP